MTAMKWSKYRRTSNGTEEANPKQKQKPARGGSHVKPGPVKQWADMTEAERQDILKRIRRGGT